MNHGPLLTFAVERALRAAHARGDSMVQCSLDLERSRTTVEPLGDGFVWQHCRYPFADPCRERTVYYWTGGEFSPAARYGGSLVKLVPTQWGAPTFEIDGIKMLPTARISPFVDAQNKVDSVHPRDGSVLDTCGGLGYFAAWCLRAGVREVLSFEKNPDVIWLRTLNPWSPGPDARLTLTAGDVALEIRALPSAAFDAVLHDPPRFGRAGELYSLDFYLQLARVLRRRGRLFHYTGTPNRLTSGRDVPNEVARRLRHAGFEAAIAGDGVRAVRL